MILRNYNVLTECNGGTTVIGVGRIQSFLFWINFVFWNFAAKPLLDYFTTYFTELAFFGFLFNYFPEDWVPNEIVAAMTESWEGLSSHMLL